MSTKNTKKNNTTLAAASSLLHDATTGFGGETKERVRINPGFMVMSLWL